MVKIGERHVSLDSFLEERGEVGLLLLLPNDPLRRIGAQRKILLALVDGHDNKASEVYLPCFIKAIEDVELALDSGDGSYGAWQRANSRVASELKQLFTKLPIREDCKPAMMKTRKVILTEIAFWMSETRSDVEATDLLNFFLKQQGGDQDKILEEALRQSTEKAVSPSRLIQLYLRASAEKRPCEDRGVVCKVLAMAITRNSNDWYLHQVFAATEPLPVGCTDEAYVLLRREAIRIAKLDADYRQLRELLREEEHSKESVLIEYPEDGGWPIVTIVRTVGHWKKEYEADSDRMLLAYADIARNWFKEYRRSVQLRLQTFLYTGNKEMVSQRETLID